MADTDFAESRSAEHLAAVGRSYGWEAAWAGDGRLRLTLLEWTLTAVFTDDGAFAYARASGPDSVDMDLDLDQVLDALEEYGNPPPQGAG